MELTDQVRAAGVVGAGGGGFPAHVKLASRAHTIIANGAECEPLLHKDAAVLEHRADAVVQGILLCAEAIGAGEIVIAIKAKKEKAVAAARAACAGTRARVHLLDDYYPAGDEYDLVYNITGRLIPPAGLPVHVGAVVQNVETLANIADAAVGRPVTRKCITIAGAVAHPATFEVPLGISLSACIEAAGGATVPDPVLAVGGMMMGEIVTDPDRPVTKTTAGVIVLPARHPVIGRKQKPPREQAAIGKSACDQCRYCTEFCPRYLLGYGVEPHQVMRALGFTATGSAHFSEWAALCCSCGLCTLYACPEMLYPKEACDDSKALLRKLDWKWNGQREVTVHPMHDGRRVPIKSLLSRLSIEEYDDPAPLAANPLTTRRALLPLKQHAGPPALASVKAGQLVAAGEVVAAPAPDALGALLHAPFTARVESVGTTEIALSAL